MKRRLFDHPTLYVVVAAYIVATYSTLLLGDRVVNWMVPEDHYAEYAGAVSFLLASVFFFVAFLRLRRASDDPDRTRVKLGVLLSLALLFFVGFGEEISWGQRIFGIEEPEALGSINKQSELNVHNIEIGSWTIPYETAFDLMWLLLVVVVPLVAHFSGGWRGRFSRWIPVPKLGIGALFVFNYVMAKVAKALFDGSYTYANVPFTQAVQEVKESNYAVLFALVALYTMVTAGYSAGATAERTEPDHRNVVASP